MKSKSVAFLLASIALGLFAAPMLAIGSGGSLATTWNGLTWLLGATWVVVLMMTVTLGVTIILIALTKVGRTKARAVLALTWALIGLTIIALAGGGWLIAVIMAALAWVMTLPVPDAAPRKRRNSSITTRVRGWLIAILTPPKGPEGPAMKAEDPPSTSTRSTPSPDGDEEKEMR